MFGLKFKEQVVANIQDSKMVVSEFEFQMHYHFNFSTNTLRKAMDPFILIPATKKLD